MDDSNSITILAASGTFSSTGTSMGPVTTNVVDGNTVGAQWSNNISYTWTCASCGALVCNGQWHVCPQNSFQMPQAKPHRCPVCEGRGKVLFDPENPFRRTSAVEEWPCKPCNATGIVWGY